MAETSIIRVGDDVAASTENELDAIAATEQTIDAATKFVMHRQIRVGMDK